MTLGPRLQALDAGSADAVSAADAICHGAFRLFEHHLVHLGELPDWHRDPLIGTEYPPHQHWSVMGDFDRGDIKLVWEPSRFAWVFPLVRAYWRTGDEGYARRFWQLLEHWREHNAPQQGVHWKCGQEIALRVMAICFALYGFATSPETHPRRIAGVAQLMAICGHRLAANLDYALSQQNNHGIVEANGLWTIGLLFPELQGAQTWVARGRCALETQVQSLIDEDGAFSQSSVNYQRVMLHACLWAFRLGAVYGQPLSEDFRTRVARAGRFLHALMEERTGQCPRYGQNDGALIVSLTGCAADDYRPVIQSTSLVTTGQGSLPPGPWDEEALWLGGAAAPEAASASDRPRQDWYAPAGGYQVLRSEEGHLFTRAGAWRHRPSHADLLHADVWWRGINVALDAGTYSYNAAAPWNNPLAGTSFHNGITVDGRDQMRRAGRFLWLPWIKGERNAYQTSPAGQLTYWEGTHDGYRRLADPVTYHRAILRVGAAHWVVVDRLRSLQPHDIRLHWLLVDAPFEADRERLRVELATTAGDYAVQMCAVSGEAASPECLETPRQGGASLLDFSVVRADPESPRGWHAPHYRDRRPAVSVALCTRAACCRVCTVLGPADTSVTAVGSRLQVRFSGGVATIDLSHPELVESPVLVAASIRGPATDEISLGPILNKTPHSSGAS